LKADRLDAWKSAHEQYKFDLKIQASRIEFLKAKIFGINEFFASDNGLTDKQALEGIINYVDDLIKEG